MWLVLNAALTGVVPREVRAQRPDEYGSTRAERSSAGPHVTGLALLRPRVAELKVLRIAAEKTRPQIDIDETIYACMSTNRE